MLFVPLLKENELIGVVSLARQEARPFTEKHVELVQSFASQAVIAIENTRLLNELRESLAQQTATADVLRVISSSPGELEPVFEAMLQNAVRICGARFGNLFLYQGEFFRIGATYGAPHAYVEYLHREGPFRADPRLGLGRLRLVQRLLGWCTLAATTQTTAGRDAGKGESGMRVGLLIPCYVDAFFPDVGIATLQLLERLGIDVIYPLDQTCCGQPMANSGCQRMRLAPRHCSSRTFRSLKPSSRHRGVAPTT